MSSRPLRRLSTVALLGGYAGANLRYAVELLAPGLPATLAVNAAGSLALGNLAGAGLAILLAWLLVA